jgi:hypothetical protein
MTEPTPVTPLEYSNRSREPWLPMIRFMAIAAIFYAAIPIVSYLWVVGFVVAQQFSTPPTARTIGYRSTEQLLVELPSHIAGAIVVVGGILAARINPAGRKTILISVVIYVLCNAGSAVWSVRHMLSTVPIAQYGPEFILYYSTSTFFSLALHDVVPVLLFLFFRRKEVRDVMESAWQ